MKFLLPLLLTALLSAAPQVVDKIAAKAHGEIITMSELNIKLGPIQSVLMSQFPRKGPAYEKNLKEVRDAMLDELIDRALIYGEYKSRIAAIPDHVVDEEVEKIVNNVYAGNKKLFQDYLRATGLTREKFKEQQRKEILVSMVKSQHYGDLPPPTNAELQKDYAEWKIPNRDRTKDVATYRKIYIRKIDPENPTITPESQLALAEEIAKKLEAGAEFGSLAKEFSTDLEAENGGLWKNVPRTDMAHEFGFIVFETTGNEVMGPLEDPHGYTLVEVVERDFGPSKPLAEVREVIEKRVNDKKKKAEFDKWMDKMREGKMIRKNL